MNSEITLTDLESAINYWRRSQPSVGEEMRLCPEASALANHYALMIISHRHSLGRQELEPRALEAFETWHATTKAIERR